MISFLVGKVVELTPSQVLLDVNGVGYQIQPSPRLVAELKLNQTANIQVGLVVREDSWTLFGFVDAAEKSMFETLQKVSGVGPKLAMTILSAATPAELADALTRGDEASLTRIPGVGKKSAARLILELADRLPKSQLNSQQADVALALENLGWPIRDVEQVLSKLFAETPDLGTAEALKFALGQLSKGGRR
ncbi:MAG: Holliday junction branch migration protein RuvA [Actinomycetota bacterium]